MQMRKNWIVKEGNDMTKKEFTDYLFKAMYELGYREAEVVKGHIFFYKPPVLMTMWTPRIPVELTCFDGGPQCIDIGEYLGIVDWSKVKVDTPILVDETERLQVKRHFARFDGEHVYYYGNGRSSWTFDSTESISPKYVKLAEV